MPDIHDFESTYVLFCKIKNLDTCDTENIGAKLSTLNIIVNGAIVQAASGGDRAAVKKLPSLVGQIVLVPAQVRKAIRIALAVMSAAESAGISLIIGVTNGRLEPVTILGSPGFVGAAINMAARIASCPNATGVCVTEEVKNTADRVSKFEFGPPITDHVPHKSGIYRFYSMVRAISPPTSKALSGDFQGNSRDATIIVFDIAKYSDGDHGNQVVQVFQCLRALTLAGGRRVEFIPTGDGGVLVVTSAEGGVNSALHLAADLYLRLQEGSKLFANTIQVRISIHFGPVQKVRGVGSVGPDIFECDAYNAYAEPHKICASPAFWKAERLGHPMTEWIAETQRASTPRAGFNRDLNDYYLIYKNNWGSSSRPEVARNDRQESEMPTQSNQGIKRDGEIYAPTGRVDHWVSEFRKG